MVLKYEARQRRKEQSPMAPKQDQVSQPAGGRPFGEPRNVAVAGSSEEKSWAVQRTHLITRASGSTRSR